MNLLLAAIGKPFIPGWDMLGPFIAELVLVLTIIAVLIAPFFRRSNALTGAISLLGIVVALVCLLWVWPIDAGMRFADMLVSDRFAVMWKVLLLVFAGGIILMWFSTSAAGMHEGDGVEFFTLLLGATLGMCLMGSTGNLLMIFMVVEMASLPSYVLAGFRKTSVAGSEASLKYVLFGAATAAVMVYGLSFLYGLYGTLQLEQIAPHLAERGGIPLAVGLAGIIVGLGFKISAVPFHFWCPDVFEGAAVDVAAFLSVASKGAGLVLLLRVLSTLAEGADPLAAGRILSALAIVIGVLGAITATVGNVAAFVQTNMKRLLAYSSIAHAGYMLCLPSLLVPGAAGDGANTAVAGALLLYLAVYLFMNLGAFTVVGMVWRQTGSENIQDYAALGRRNPVLALCMAAFLFSLVGLPPFAGFVAKLNVMLVLGEGGGWWWALVGVIGVNTILSLYYYVRVVRMMYLVDSDRPALELSPLGSALCVLCAAMLVGMLVAFHPMAKLSASYGRLITRAEAPQGLAQAGPASDDSAVPRTALRKNPGP